MPCNFTAKDVSNPIVFSYEISKAPLNVLKGANFFIDFNK